MSENRRATFREEQRFNQWWLLLIICIVPILTIIGVVDEYRNLSESGDSTDFIIACVVGSIVSVGVPLLFFFMRLITEVRANGIHIRFIPFHWSPKVFHWDDIDTWETRTYRPIHEYGGWGVRGGFWGSGTAYNVKGDQGLQLVMKDGKRILIGTQQPSQIRNAIKKAQSK